MRLIDADALLKHEIEADRMGAMLVVGKGHIFSAPTIEIVQQTWISVKERLPEDEEKYLVCCCTVKGIKGINLAWFDGAYWHGMGSMSRVTHWMQLPKLPEVNSCLS